MSKSVQVQMQELIVFLKKRVKNANIGIRKHTEAANSQTIFRCELPFQAYDWVDSLTKGR